MAENNGFDIENIGNVDDSLGNADIDKDTLKEQKRARYSQDTSYRKYLAVWVMVVTSLWLLAVMVVLILIGAGVLTLDSTVIVTLLATTTANVLGLPLIVLKGIYK